MFKKTLAAVAVLGAFAGSAFAANVTMYGIVDTGLGFTSKDKGYGEEVNTFDMRSGQNSATRLGLKGEEDLGNGVKVGFVLENGFDTDDGELGNDGRLFGREALLYINGGFGELGMGRQGELASGNGRYGLFGGKVSPFSTGWSDIGGHKYVMGAGFDRMDNTVTYKTPTFAGFNLLAQYSFDKNVKKDDNDDEADGVQHGREGSAEADRQYALGATFAAGDLYLAGIVTQTNKQSVNADGTSLGEQDDPLTVSLGGNYNFGVAKLYVATQYFKDSDLAVAAVQAEQKTGKYNGYGLSVGVDVPAFGGTAKALVAYMDAEDQAGKKNKAGEFGYHDMQRYVFSVGYEYPLSKRTFVYGGAGYYMDSYDRQYDKGYDDKGSVAAVNAGLVHKF